MALGYWLTSTPACFAKSRHVAMFVLGEGALLLLAGIVLGLGAGLAGSRLLRGLRAVGRAIPRPGMVVRAVEGQELGAVTSGTFSPTLKTGIALALIDSAVAVDDVVSVDVRGRAESFMVVKPPFVTPGVREP